MGQLLLGHLCLCMWEAVLRQEEASGPEEGWAACITAWLDKARLEGKDACWLKDKYSSSVQPSSGDYSAPEHGHASAILSASQSSRCLRGAPACHLPLENRHPAGEGLSLRCQPHIVCPLACLCLPSRGASQQY